MILEFNLLFELNQSLKSR